jgi:hypothetical protein
MSDWRIRSKAPACQRCARAFQEDETHYSVLYFGAQGLQRQDRCASCFREKQIEGPGEELSWWRTRAAEQKRGATFDLVSIEALFQRLEARAEVELVELRSLLALILLRKRRLKLVRFARQRPSELMIVRRPRHTEEIEVAFVELAPARLAQLGERLAGICDGLQADELRRPELIPPGSPIP